MKDCKQEVITQIAKDICGRVGPLRKLPVLPEEVNHANR